MLILGWDEFSEKARNLVHYGIRLIEDGLGITLTEMLIQLCATLVLFLVVRFFVWNKVTAILDARKKKVRDALQSRDEAIKAHDELIQENEKEREKLKLDANKIVENAKQKSYIEAEQIIKDAELEAKQKIESAEKEIQIMISESEEEMKKEMVNVAYEMAEAIVQKEIEKEQYPLNVDEFMKKVHADDKNS